MSSHKKIELSVPVDAVWTPIEPIGEKDFLSLDHGDPFAITVPPEIVDTPFRYVVYTTGHSAPDGEGEALPFALQTDENAEHWAPEVTYLYEHERKCPKFPWVMKCSVADGLGADKGHIGHKIITAYAKNPIGPFRKEFGTVLSRGDKVKLSDGSIASTHNHFAIDPDTKRLKNGKFAMMFCVNIIHDSHEDQRIGTAIVSAPWDPITDQLTEIPTVVSRPEAAWQLYEKGREVAKQGITVPGLPPGGRVDWYCKEGPVILSDTEALYSGGCFKAGEFYAVGILKKIDGRWIDQSIDKENCLLLPNRVSGIESIGHCSVFRDLQGVEYVMAHVRMAKGERQMMLIPFIRTDDKFWCPTPEELTHLNEPHSHLLHS